MESEQNNKPRKVFKDGKTFKEYYADNPDFRNNQLAYQKEKIPCEICDNHMHQRCNMSTHRKSKKHLRNKALNEAKTEQAEVELTDQQIRSDLCDLFHKALQDIDTKQPRQDEQIPQDVKNVLLIMALMKAME